MNKDTIRDLSKRLSQKKKKERRKKKLTNRKAHTSTSTTPVIESMKHLQIAI